MLFLGNGPTAFVRFSERLQFKGGVFKDLCGSVRFPWSILIRGKRRERCNMLCSDPVPTSLVPWGKRSAPGNTSPSFPACQASILHLRQFWAAVAAASPAIHDPFHQMTDSGSGQLVDKDGDFSKPAKQPLHQQSSPELQQLRPGRDGQCCKACPHGAPPSGQAQPRLLGAWRLGN